MECLEKGQQGNLKAQEEIIECLEKGQQGNLKAQEEIMRYRESGIDSLVNKVHQLEESVKKV
jgi:hypothetical protein